MTLNITNPSANLQASIQSLNNNVQKQVGQEQIDTSPTPPSAINEATRNIDPSSNAIRQLSPATLIEISSEREFAEAKPPADSAEIEAEIANATNNALDIANAIEAFKAADDLLPVASAEPVQIAEAESEDIEIASGEPRSADVIAAATQVFTEVDISV